MVVCCLVPTFRPIHFLNPTVNWPVTTVTIVIGMAFYYIEGMSVERHWYTSFRPNNTSIGNSNFRYLNFLLMYCTVRNYQRVPTRNYRTDHRLQPPVMHSYCTSTCVSRTVARGVWRESAHNPWFPLFRDTTRDIHPTYGQHET